MDAPFYVFSPLGAPASAEVWGWVLIILMAVTMFVAQRQMTARSLTGADNPQAQQQKMLQYMMPILLVFFAWGLPVGVLLYWVTTNLWQLGQQAIMLREIQAHPTGATAGDGRASGAHRTAPSTKTSQVGKKAVNVPKPTASPNGERRRSEHLPRRGRGSKGGRSR